MDDEEETATSLMLDEWDASEMPTYRNQSAALTESPGPSDIRFGAQYEVRLCAA